MTKHANILSNNFKIKQQTNKINSEGYLWFSGKIWRKDKKKTLSCKMICKFNWGGYI